MSLEAALEEERLEILKLLERPAGRKSSTPPHPSGTYSTPSSPRQGYSSLARAASPAGRQVSSLIDAVSDLNIPSSGRNSGTSTPNSTFRSPSSPPPGLNGVYRNRLGPEPPRILGQHHRMSMGASPNDAFNFNMEPTAVGGSGNPKLRHNSNAQPGKFGSSNPLGRSRSPLAGGGRNGYRSPSPGSSLLAAAALPQESGRKILTEHGQIVDLDHAYALLNDSAFQGSGGVLKGLPERKPMLDEQGLHVRAGSGESLTSDGGIRLQKDVEMDEQTIVDSTDEESSEDESPRSGSEDEERRGRSRRTVSLIDAANEERGDSSEREHVKSMLDLGIDSGGGKKKKKKGKKAVGSAAAPRGPAKSLLAAAEDERKSVAARQKYKVRSLLPSISVSADGVPGATSPTTSRRSGVHPSTSYDIPSTASTPVSSDQEADDLDIRRAQRMEMAISPIISTPESQRVIRTIFRGDYESIHSAAAGTPEPGARRKRRARKYLVATDLSAEAQYAMEWTIGTVLRDGDTLMALYVADQDTIEDPGKVVSGTSGIESAVNDALEMNAQAQAAASGTMTPPLGSGTPTQQFAQLAGGQYLPNASSPLAPPRDFNTERGSRERTKAEVERCNAAEDITKTVTRLLKKTRLQVKVIVEVIHCKSPKHLLTEIIDLCEPTLVVLGSRGRSALKGVLLGSFSNYLVTKSSVPVMVARKKLKHTKKYQHMNTRVRLSNNLESNKSRILANAKVD